MRKIKLNRGLVALVDDADWPLLSQFRWSASGRAPRFYADRHDGYGRGAPRMYMHRQILGARDRQYVDHINGNTLDNRRENLRLCTPGQNNANCLAPSRGKFGRGVEQRSPGRWVARIIHNGRRLYLGFFSAPETAARAYEAAAVLLWGEFARPRLNVDPTSIRFPPAAAAYLQAQQADGTWTAECSRAASCD